MPRNKFTPEKASEAGKKSKRGPADLTSLAYAIYLKALTNSLPEVESAMKEVRAEDPYKFLALVEKFGQKILPNQIDVTSDGNELTLLSNDELVARLNKLIARFDQD